MYVYNNNIYIIILYIYIYIFLDYFVEELKRYRQFIY